MCCSCLVVVHPWWAALLWLEHMCGRARRRRTTNTGPASPVDGILRGQLQGRVVLQGGVRRGSPGQAPVRGVDRGVGRRPDGRRVAPDDGPYGPSLPPPGRRRSDRQPVAEPPGSATATRSTLSSSALRLLLLRDTSTIPCGRKKIHLHIVPISAGRARDLPVGPDVPAGRDRRRTL